MMRLKVFALAAAVLLGGFLLPVYAQTLPGQTLGITPTSPAITSGAFTANSGSVAPVPESSAVFDTIVTINGGKGGERITIRAPSGKELLLDNGAGNLVLQADAFLNNNDSITLQKIGSSWYEVSRDVTAFAGGDASYASVYALARDLAIGNSDASTPQFGGSLTINGESLGNYSYVVKRGDQTLNSFTESEWFTDTDDSEAAFIVVNGDLTINNGLTIAPHSRKLFTAVYVTGNLTFSNIEAADDTKVGPNPFAVTSGSRLVTVTHTAHGRAVGDWVYFIGASAGNGVTISGGYRVLSVPTADTYTIRDTQAGTSSGSGGGTGVVVHSGISMSGAGANHGVTGSNVAAAPIFVVSGTTVAATCGDGGAAVVRSTSGNTAGTVGQSAATAVCTGGGGGASGAVRNSGGTDTATSGAGAEATAFSGGPGGGSAWASSFDATGLAGTANGGAGGDGDISSASTHASGGAGNPGGDDGDGSSGSDGMDGTGGTLFVIVEGEVAGDGRIAATGMPGGNTMGDDTGDVPGAGSSGGGVASLHYGTLNATNPNQNAAGGEAGNANGTYSHGGAGGAGTTQEVALSGALSFEGYEGVLVIPPTLIDLTDGPGTYEGQAAALVNVDENENGWSFISPNDVLTTATDSDTPRTQADREGEWLNVKDYGAVGDCDIDEGGTDDTAAIQAASDVDRSQTLYFPPGNYCVTELDWTQFTSRTVVAYGAVLIGTEAGVEAIVDAVNAEKLRLLGLHIKTQTGVVVRNGMQMARITSNGANHVLDYTRVEGSFSLAGLNLGPSDFPQYRGLNIYNDYDTADSYALVMGMLNMFVTYSRFAGHADNGGQDNTNARPIVSISKAATGVMTLASGHEIDNNELLVIRDVVGMTEINTTLKATPAAASTVYCAQNVTATTVDLYEYDCTTPLDTSGGGYTAYTSGGLVAPYGGVGTSNALFVGGAFVHQTGPAAFLQGLQSTKFENSYFYSNEPTAGAAAVTFYGDHSEPTGRFKDLQFDVTIEDSNVDHAYKFMGETGFMVLSNFTGRDHSVNVGDTQFAAVDGMSVNFPNFNYHFGGTTPAETLFGPVNGGTTGTFTVNGVIGATGSYGLASSEVNGLPAKFIGDLTLVDANDPAYGVGTQVIHSALMNETAISYMPVKGQTCWFGTAAGTYAVETLQSQSSLCVDGTGAFTSISDPTTALSTFTNSASTPEVQFFSLSTPTAAFVRSSANVSGPANIMAKSRGASSGLYDVVVDADELGRVAFEGADGDEFQRGADITAYVNGTPGDADMPGALAFRTTPDGQSEVVERFRIDAKGHGEWTHLGTGTTPPTSDCGTSDVIETGSTDNVGRIEVGTTPGSSCTLTFAAAWTNAPHCSVNNEDSVARAVTMVTSTTTNVLITFAGTLDAADSISYHCVGFTG
jgi:hypothetical protein